MLNIVTPNPSIFVCNSINKRVTKETPSIYAVFSFMANFVCMNEYIEYIIYNEADWLNFVTQILYVCRNVQPLLPVCKGLCMQRIN